MGEFEPEDEDGDNSYYVLKLMLSAKVGAKTPEFIFASRADFQTWYDGLSLLTKKYKKTSATKPSYNQAKPDDTSSTIVVVLDL